MSVRRVSPRLRPGLTMALVLSGFLLSLAVTSGVGTEAAAADPASPPPTTSTTAPPTTTTTPPTTTSPPTTTTTGAPATTTPSTVPRTTTVPSTVPQTTAVPPTSTTTPQNQSTGPVALAVVVSTGDGLAVQSADGTQGPAQVGQSLQPGDQLSTTGTPGSSAAHPATIRWLQGGTTDIYDATPRIFVSGHKSVPPVATVIVINADPTPTLRVNQGFARFWFSPGEKGWYSFVASTDAVVATVKGTDFTIGEDPVTRTSTVGVTQDTVEVAPVNTSLHAFQLSAGSQVQVSPDRVGPITPLADQSANSAQRPSSRSTTTTLALWLVGLLLTVAVVSGAVGLASLWRDRHHGRPDRPSRALRWPGWPVAGLRWPEWLARRRRDAPPVPALPPRPVVSPDLSFAHAGPPGATGWITLPSGAAGEATDPVPEIGAEPRRRPEARPAWEPTHRVPPEGMKARAIPVADAGDVATLDPGLAVRLVERRGDWANVLSADGWSGWVDASKLRAEPDSG